MVYFPPISEGLPEPMKCPGCEKWFVLNPAMANVSCCVLHGPGSCCHFSETEVPAPEETPEERKMRLETAATGDLTDEDLYEDLTNILDDCRSVMKELGDG